MRVEITCESHRCTSKYRSLVLNHHVDLPGSCSFFTLWPLFLLQSQNDVLHSDDASNLVEDLVSECATQDMTRMFLCRPRVFLGFLGTRSFICFQHLDLLGCHRRRHRGPSPRGVCGSHIAQDIVVSDGQPGHHPTQLQANANQTKELWTPLGRPCFYQVLNLKCSWSKKAFILFLEEKHNKTRRTKAKESCLFLKSCSLKSQGAQEFRLRSQKPQGLLMMQER